MIFLTIFAPPIGIGIGESVAQQVEHNTFNVGVPGSSPGGFTEKRRVYRLSFFRESVFTFPLNPPLTKGDLFLLNVLPNTPADNPPSPTHIMRVVGIECDLLLDLWSAQRGIPASWSYALRFKPRRIHRKSGSYDYRNCLFCFYSPCFCYFCVNRSVNHVNQNERNN